MLLNALESRVLFAVALEHRFAVLAVNADSPAAITDCLEAARRCEAPIIIEASLWQLKGHSFGAQDAALGMARYLGEIAILANSERYRELPVVFHTDHIKGPEALPLLKKAIQGLVVHLGEMDLPLRPSTLSLDSSEMTAAQNISAISELCETADSLDQSITLEMEAGVDQGVTPLSVAEDLLGTVERRYPGKVFLWAPGVGTQHGFSTQGYPTFSPSAVREHQQLSTRLMARPIGIVLHGSSGLPEARLREAVQAGVVKVNWSSESLLIRSQAARTYYEEKGGHLESKHPDFKNTAMDNGVQVFVSERYLPKVCERVQILGSAGQAPACYREIVRRTDPVCDRTKRV